MGIEGGRETTEHSIRREMLRSPEVFISLSGNRQMFRTPALHELVSSIRIRYTGIYLAFMEY